VPKSSPAAPSAKETPLGLPERAQLAWSFGKVRLDRTANCDLSRPLFSVGRGERTAVTALNAKDNNHVYKF
jgi:hypothetical protein